MLTFILSTPILFLTKNSQHDSTFWLLGSFTELNKHHVKVFAPFVEVGIITSFFVARKILNESNVVKLFVAIGSAFLIGPWVNVTGAILGFGIFIPFITKRLIKGDTRRVLSYAALTGPIILIILDVLINKLNDISVSVITLAFSLLLSLFGKKQAQRQS